MKKKCLLNVYLHKDDRRFGLNLASVEYMANLLLESRRAHAPVHSGLTGSSNENQSFKCDSLAPMTSKGLMRRSWRDKRVVSTGYEHEGEI